MAKYKKYNYAQMVMIPVSLEDQLLPGTLEYTIHEVVETRVDLSVFVLKYNNDESGARRDPGLQCPGIGGRQTSDHCLCRGDGQRTGCG